MISRPSLLGLLSVGVFLAACSPAPQGQVAGSSWLSADRQGGVHDVLAYPISEDELLWFENVLPLVEATAKERSEEWAEISSAEEPSFAADQNDFWDRCDLLGRDVISVMLKLTFLQEFAETDEGEEADMRSNLYWLDERMKGEEANSELLETANSIRAILNVLEAHREAGTFEYYAQNKERIDAALDRFTSIGEL